MIYNYTVATVQKLDLHYVAIMGNYKKLHES